MTHFRITDHISQVNVQINYCNNNHLILDVKKLNKIMKFHYIYTLKALWDGQGKIKMCYGMSRVKKQLSGKKFIENHWMVVIFFLGMCKTETFFACF